MAFKDLGLPLSAATQEANLRLWHETLQCIKSLLQRLSLSGGQTGAQQTILEFLVVEARSVLLLFNPKLSQNTHQGVHIKWHASIILTDSHEIKHSLSI